MSRIAFLGLGRMGFGMAGRLVDAGHQVVLWNRTRAKAEPLMAKGALFAATPADAVQGAEIICTMLADDPAATAVWLGAEGALAAASPGALAIEFSTVSHPFMLRLAAAAQDKGLAFIDCPVTGRPDAAAAGKLTLLVGASPADLERARPVLTQLSEKIRHFGPAGAGTAYKLMINLMGAVQISALAEGLVLADRAGLDRRAVMEAIADSASASRQVVYHVRRMSEETFADPTFTAELRHKDASYGLALARQHGVAAHLGSVATAWFDSARKIDPNGDEARVVKVVAGARGTA